MILYLIGIDHKTAPLALRESIYRNREEIVDFWRDKGEEGAVLFTCNRIELYGVSEDVSSASDTIDLFRSRFPAIFKRSYVRQGNREVIEHALRLSCGLESQITGEKEILEQLNSWIKEDSFPWLLKKIWEEVLTAAEDIRSRSGLSDTRSNIAEVIFRHLTGRKEIAVVGTGKVARVFSENKPEGVSLYFVARKRHKKAARLARHSAGKAVLLGGLPDLLLNVDAVISATSSPHYVLKKEYFLNIARKRKSPLYLYDLAVPRDIEPETKEIENIFLQDLDGLAPLFEQHNKELDGFVEKAELLISGHTFDIEEKLREDSSVYSY